MYQSLNEFNRPISEFSNTEFELQKACFRKPSITAMLGIKKLLADLYDDGIFVHVIQNYEVSPCVRYLPDSVVFLTGGSHVIPRNRLRAGVINVTWDLWRNEAIQHVVESEAV